MGCRMPESFLRPRLHAHHLSEALFHLQPVLPFAKGLSQCKLGESSIRGRILEGINESFIGRMGTSEHDVHEMIW